MGIAEYGAESTPVAMSAVMNVMKPTYGLCISLPRPTNFVSAWLTKRLVCEAAGPKGFAVDIRQRLGLLVLEHEHATDGLVRITTDQARRTAQRLEGQIKTAKERAPKKPRVKKEPKPPKVKVAKPRKPRKPKVKHEMETTTTESTTKSQPI